MVPADSGGITRVPPYSGCRAGDKGFGYGAITLCGAAFQAASPRLRPAASAVLQPRGRPKTTPVWAPPLSLATTRGIIGLFSLPAGTKMFQFPAFASPTQKGGYRLSRWVVPFGDPRIKGHLRLPADYRSLSRPSSPPRAKASAMRPRITSTPCALELLPRHPPKGGRRSTCVLACADCQRSIAETKHGGVENNGFEPLTPCLQSRCSSQLS